MANQDQKVIDQLNNLLEINNDRTEGYTTAAKETNEQDLKALFSECAAHSNTCKQELIAEITRLGGKPVQGTRNTGKLYRAWMDMKAALTGKDRKAILNSCEFGEDVAVKNYDDALRSNELAGLHQLINKQYGIIKGDHDKIRSLRDALKAAKV